LNNNNNLYYSAFCPQGFVNGYQSLLAFERQENMPVLTVRWWAWA